MVVIVVMVVAMVVIGVVLVRIGVTAPRGSPSSRHVGQLEDEIDHLVLEDRRPELGQELGVVAVVVEDLALLAGKLPHALEQGPAHLLVGDGDLIAGADFRQDQPEPDAALGRSRYSCAPLPRSCPRPRRSACGVRDRPSPAPNRIELVVNQRRRKLEAVALAQSIEKRALEPEPRDPGPLLLQPLA